VRNMTVSLRELQEQFQSYVINKEQKILDNISTEQVSAIERIDVYREGYSLRLLEILEKNFPVLLKIIGHEKFTQLGRQYIESYPSDNFNICIFARHYPKFLLDQNQDPFWSEVAEFEWALAIALDAADAPQIDMSHLSELTEEDWPNLQFSIHPSLECYKFKFNTPQIVIAHLLEEDVPELVPGDEDLDWIVWRLNLQSYFERITPQHLWMINALHQNKTFAQLCDGLCEWFSEEEVAQFAAGSLGNWLSKGIFSGFTVAPLDVVAE
jgi:hypothetical protein